MVYVSKNQPITEALQMAIGAWNGDPAVKAQQQAFELEQARTDAYLQKSEADIADMNAKLALQKELNAGQINQYSAAADKYRADAANALLERDGLAAQLDSRKKYEEGLGSALAPEPTQMDIGGPLNAKAAGPVQIPKGTPLPPTPQQFASRLAKNAPAMFASGMNPDQAANAVLLMSTLGANAGIVPPDQQEAFNRNALIGTGKMPDLNTALTTGRQNEVINLNAKNDQALEKAKPTSLTTSGLQAGVWNKMLNDPNYTPTPQEQALLNSGSKKTTTSVGPNGEITIAEEAGGGFGTVANNTLDKAVIDADRNLRNLARMRETFDPNFATVQGKASAEITNLMDKFQLGTITPEENQKLQDYSQFAQATITSLNDYIRAMTGAALSPGEVPRALEAMPNIGTGGIMGIVQGDGPVRFMAKLDGAETWMRAIQKRSTDLKALGINAVTDDFLAQNPQYSIDNYLGGQAPQQGLGSQLQPAPQTPTVLNFDAQGNPI